MPSGYDKTTGMFTGGAAHNASQETRDAWARGDLSAFKGFIGKPGPGAPPTHDREQIMEHVIDQILCGRTLTSIVKGLKENGFTPVKMSAIMIWLVRFPSFRTAYDRARELGAHALMDSAVDDLDLAVDRETALAARTKSDGKMKAASRWNRPQFGDNVPAAPPVSVTIISNLDSPKGIEQNQGDPFTLTLEVDEAQATEDQE